MYYMNNTTTVTAILTTSRILDRLEIKILFTLIMISLCLVTTIGNLIVVYKYGRKRNSVGNLFIISLAIADLIVGSFVMPIASIYSFTEKWNFSLLVCKIWLSADYTASTASILNLLTLSLDRYWSITSPLKYLGKRTKTRALLMIAIVWVLSLLWVIPITLWPYITNNGVSVVAVDECDTEYKHHLSFKVITAIFNFYVPLIAMIIINTKIYIVIRKRYRSPIMQYTSGPFSKYSWVQNSNVHTQQPTAQPPSDTVNSTKLGSLDIQRQKNFFTKFHFYLTKPKNENTQTPNTTPIVANKNQLSNKKFKFLKFQKYSILKPFCRLDKDPVELKSFKTHYNLSLLRKSSLDKNVKPFRSSFKETDLDINSATTRNRQQSNCCEYHQNRKSQQERKYSDSSLYGSLELYHKANEQRLSVTSINTKQTPLMRQPSTISKTRCSFKNYSDATNEDEHTPQRNEEKCASKNRISFLFRNGSIMNRNSCVKRSTNNQAFFNKQEKAFAQLACIVIGFTICFTPYFVVFLVVAFCSSCVNQNIFQIALWLGYINSTINPFLYTLSSRRYTKKFSRKSNTTLHHARNLKTASNISLRASYRMHDTR